MPVYGGGRLINKFKERLNQVSQTKSYIASIISPLAEFIS